MIPSVATNFLYDDEKLSDYGMILCKFDNNSSETVSAGNSLVFNTIKSGNSDKNYLISSSYDEPLSITFQICKDDSNDNNHTISSEELTSMLRWLSRRDGFHKFKIYQQGYENIFFYGSFNNIQQIKINGELCGLELTFTADSPYGYEDISFDLTTAATVGCNIYNMSSEPGHLYPKVFTCKCLQSGDLTIHNSIENRTTEIKNCVKDEIITLYGNSKVIESSVSTHKLYNDFNYNYFRLGNTYDNNLNTITTSIPCEIHIEYEAVRKVGLG